MAAALTSVPGSSAAVRGGIVAYATDLKAALLDVPADLLERHGAVHGAVAEAMAEGTRDRLGATTGNGLGPWELDWKTKHRMTRARNKEK